MILVTPTLKYSITVFTKGSNVSKINGSESPDADGLITFFNFTLCYPLGKSASIALKYILLPSTWQLRFYKVSTKTHSTLDISKPSAISALNQLPFTKSICVVN